MSGVFNDQADVLLLSEFNAGSNIFPRGYIDRVVRVVTYETW